MKKKLLLLIQTLVSVGLLAGIFSQGDLRMHAGQVLRSAHPGWLFLGLIFAGIVQVVGVARWGIFLRVLEIPLSGWEMLRMAFVGLFFNSFLPGAVGGDAVKVVWLVARGTRKSAALLSVIMDRMSGLGALIVCSLALMLPRMDWLLQSPIVAKVMHFVLIYLGGIVVLLALSFVMAALGLTKRLPNLPGKTAMLEFSGAYLKFIERWPQTLLAMAISAVTLIFYFLSFYCAARAFGVQVPVLDFLSLMPAVDTISALPVSLGGLGVREQLFVTLLGDLCKVPAAQAVSISLAGALLTLAWGLVGIAVLPSYRRVAGAAKMAETPKEVVEP